MDSNTRQLYCISTFANVGMVFTGRFLAHMDDTIQVESIIDDCTYCVLLFLGTSLLLLWAVKTYFMKKEYDWLWLAKYTAADHFSNYIWENNVYDDWGTTINDHRAHAISKKFRAKYYIHDARVGEWIKENWSLWEMNPPLWFDEEFKGSLPLKLIPRHARVRRQSLLDHVISRSKAELISVISPKKKKKENTIRSLQNEDEERNSIQNVMNIILFIYMNLFIHLLYSLKK